MDFGARVAILERDTFVCTWIDSNGERSVVLLRAHAGRRQSVLPRIEPEIIGPGLDTRLVIARSVAERHASARMDHLALARVLDAGAHAVRLAFSPASYGSRSRTGRVSTRSTRGASRLCSR